MLLTIDQDSRDREHIALRSMFAARKRVFIDLLKWDIPALADQYEVDHFDDIHATYLIVTDVALRIDIDCSTVAKLAAAGIAAKFAAASAARAA